LSRTGFPRFEPVAGLLGPKTVFPICAGASH